MQRAEFGTHALMDLIQESFKSGELWTNDDVYQAHLIKFDKEVKPKKDISAMVCNMIAKGLIERMPEKTLDRMTQYRLAPVTIQRDSDPEIIMEQEEMETIQTQANDDQKDQEVDILEAQDTETPQVDPPPQQRKNQIPMKVTVPLLLETIDKDFMEKKPFVISDLKQILGINHLIYSQIAKMLTDKQIEETGNIINREKEYRRTIYVTTEGKKGGVSEETQKKSIVPEHRYFTADANDPAVITKEMLDYFDIPLSLLGDAMFYKMQELKRRIIQLEETEARLQRENESMSKRMSDQYKQIESLNIRIGQLNEEARKPKYNDRTMPLREVVKIGVLKRKAGANGY